MRIKTVLILGYGYLGQHFKNYLHSFHPDIKVFTTRRHQGEFTFDLNDKPSWDSLPSVEACLWTFPATPLSQVQNFFQSKSKNLGSVVVVGSTRALSPPLPGAPVDEHSPLNEQLDRVPGEKYLQAQGAQIILSAGIYGPNRDPRQWLLQGRINDFQRPVNFIHIHDLCQFCWKALIHPQRGQMFIACDEKTYTWEELKEEWNLHPQMPEKPHSPTLRPKKIVNAQKSRNQLDISLKYSSVLEGVQAL